MVTLRPGYADFSAIFTNFVVLKQKVVNMERAFDEQWSDFSGFYGNFHCPFCKHQSLNFSEPKYDTIAGIEVVAVSCYNCGHIELFNVAEVKREGDRLNEKYHKDGLR